VGAPRYRFRARLKKKSNPNPLQALSAREHQVLRLVVEGRSSKEIARIVGLKPSTIDTYRSRIMVKLQVSGITALVRLAIRHGVIKA
jgi:two-component system, NarL family, invasion response regulator UvrY